MGLTNLVLSNNERGRVERVEQGVVSVLEVGRPKKLEEDEMSDRVSSKL